jgi:hypothetical protein
MPVYPSKDFGARTVGNCIFLVHGKSVTVETILVICGRRYGLGAWNGRSLKAFGGKPHRQRYGN